MGRRPGYTTRGAQDKTLSSQSDHIGFQIQGRALGEAVPRGPEEHQFRGSDGEATAQPFELGFFTLSLTRSLPAYFRRSMFHTLRSESHLRVFSSDIVISRGRMSRWVNSPERKGKGAAFTPDRNPFPGFVRRGKTGRCDFPIRGH